MRIAALAFVGALGAFGLAASANAAPSIPNHGARHDANIVEAAWGCGWGFHPNRWGRCVPNRWGHWRRPHWWRHRHYYGGGYYPYRRHRYWYGY